MSAGEGLFGLLLPPPLLGTWVGWVKEERLEVEAANALKSNKIMSPRVLY